MARSIWKGNISFGLVNIPVGLYTAESRDEIHFRLLDQRTMSPIKYKRVSEKTGKEVPWEETVRGYEYEEGHYVVLSDEDLKRANPESTQTVEILEFVDADEIDLPYYDKPYYLAPLAKGGKGYALLRETLRRTNKVGIAKVVIRTKQYLSAVVVEGDALVLELLRFPHELRGTEDLDLPKGKEGVTDKELQMAERLVEAMVDQWDPEKYRDDYRKDLMALIERRVKAGETEEIEEEPVPKPEGATVVDLMALLKRSVEGGRSPRPEPERQERAQAKPAKKAAKKPAKAAAARTRKSSASARRKKKSA
jgi:DNA end-binding protein Ku